MELLCNREEKRLLTLKWKQFSYKKGTIYIIAMMGSPEGHRE
jgi:hypothetical protein